MRELCFRPLAYAKAQAKGFDFLPEDCLRVPLSRGAQLSKKRRQFQERGPDAPNQRDADNQPGDEKVQSVAGRFILLSHTINEFCLELRIALWKIKAFIDGANRKIANQSDNEQSRHQVHRRSVKTGPARTLSLQIFTDVIHQHRS